MGSIRYTEDEENFDALVDQFKRQFKLQKAEEERKAHLINSTSSNMNSNQTH